MIHVKMPSFMNCDEPGCQESVPVDLCLLMTGGFGFKPKSKEAWQVGANPQGFFIARCPGHAQQIQPAPADLKRLVTEH